MTEDTNDIIWNILNGAWKKNISILGVIIIWLALEISYIIGINPSNGETWYQAINLWYLLLMRDSLKSNSFI